MRSAATALALSLVFGASALALADPRASVVEITRNGGQLGGGVLVRPGIVLTAAHVVAGAANGLVAIWTFDGRVVEGHVRMQSPELDLALVEAPGATSPPAALGCEPVPDGLLTAIGFPFGSQFVMQSTHRVDAAEPAEIGPWAQLVMLSGPGIPGMSGGPIVDASGRVVAIAVGAFGVTASVPVGSGLGVVPVTAICDTLDALLADTPDSSTP